MTRDAMERSRKEKRWQSMEKVIESLHVPKKVFLIPALNDKGYHGKKQKRAMHSNKKFICFQNPSRTVRYFRAPTEWSDATIKICHGGEHFVCN